MGSSTRTATGRYLTAREAGWLMLHGGGMDWPAVAVATHVSADTIKTALGHTRRRWGVASTADLIAAAMRTGVLA